MRIGKLMLAITAIALLGTGCAQQKKEATQALSAIETSVSALKEDGSRYAPVAYEGVASTLAMLKDNLAKGDYQSVLAGTPQLGKAVDSLKIAIEGGKQQFEAATAEWRMLSADVPRMVEEIQSRVDTLSSARRLPRNVSQEAFDNAKSGLESMKSLWGEATAAFAAGKPGDASDAAREVKAKGEEVLKSLGMNS